MLADVCQFRVVRTQCDDLPAEAAAERRFRSLRSRGNDLSGLIARFSSRGAHKWPVEHVRTKLGDGHGIEQKDEATARDADRKVALTSGFGRKYETLQFAVSLHDITMECSKLKSQQGARRRSRQKAGKDREWKSQTAASRIDRPWRRSDDNRLAPKIAA